MTALSKQINRLEEYLGIVLFIRGRKGARLTTAGTLFLNHAQRFVQQEEHLLNMAKNIAQGHCGHFK